ncbi:MAG: hypothetical protein PHE53_06145 [Thermoguttaceae bacterium]|nr:hypothetical protein [Thermoguttaceae bacterium]
MKSREICYYSAHSGHRNHTIGHIGNVSMEMNGTALAWNPDQEKFEGNQADEANASRFVHRKQREPWTFEAVDSWINVG